MDYRPYDQRLPDSQYRDLLADIVTNGIEGPTRQGVGVKTVLGRVLHFPLGNGFPIINERSIRSFWRKPINELGAFINGVRQFEQLKAAGCDWWGAWTSESKTAKRGLDPGDIGPGSYGAAFHDFPMPNGETFDQWGNVVQQIRDYPEERRHFVSPWIPYYVYRTAENPDSSVTIAPCHGWVYIRILDGRLHLNMIQRSADVPVGVPSNMVQYAALAIFLGHLTGYPAAQYVHTFIDAHIYLDQLEHVEQMLVREPRRLATVKLNEAGLAATDIHQFSGDLFDLEDYEPHPSIPGIPVAT